jgi:phosphotransferase system enzyme I (PtsI)
VLAEYRLKQNQARLERDKLKRLRTAPAATLDGTRINLYANIELPSDVEPVKASGATGVGLFRSEFLFMNRRDQPGEDEQYEAYREVVEGLKGMPVTIRTLDLGADKSLETTENAAINPALGLRAIRYCLASRRYSTRSCARSCARRATARCSSCCRCCRPGTRSPRRSRRCGARRSSCAAKA